MILEKLTISSKKHQVIILTVLINLMLISTVILPNMDKIPYFKTKIEKLGQSKLMFENYNLHIEYYEKRTEAVLKKLEAVRKVNQAMSKPTYFPDYFGRISGGFDIEIISQQFDIIEHDPEFFRVNIHLSADGSYSELTNYLEAIYATPGNIIFHNIRFSNKDPLADNPPINLDLSIKCMFPKNI